MSFQASIEVEANDTIHYAGEQYFVEAVIEQPNSVTFQTIEFGTGDIVSLEFDIEDHLWVS